VYARATHALTQAHACALACALVHACIHTARAQRNVRACARSCIDTRAQSLTLIHTGATRSAKKRPAPTAESGGNENRRRRQPSSMPTRGAAHSDAAGRATGEAARLWFSARSATAERCRAFVASARHAYAEPASSSVARIRGNELAPAPFAREFVAHRRPVILTGAHRTASVAHSVPLYCNNRLAWGWRGMVLLDRSN
jgi:hypothetical protein